jgi:hypothetical protein
VKVFWFVLTYVYVNIGYWTVVDVDSLGASCILLRHVYIEFCLLCSSVGSDTAPAARSCNYETRFDNFQNLI